MAELEADADGTDRSAVGILLVLAAGPGVFFVGLPFVTGPTEGVFLLVVSTTLFLTSALAEFTDPTRG